LEENVKIEFKEIDINIDSVQDRDVWRALRNVTLNLQVSLNMELVN
jgi:hypothetical protein